MKLWEGRFDKPLDKMADDFNESLSFDKVMWRADIRGSLAHAAMLGNCGILTKEETASVKAGLEGIAEDIERGALVIEGAEDIHSFIETELTRRIGDSGKKLHTARSRNDQVATDFRLVVLEGVARLKGCLVGLVEVLASRARESLDYLMPGFTHLRKAQPIRCAQYFNAYSEMFLRDLDRLDDAEKRMSVMPLGSAALAGTSYPIDREQTRAALGFREISQNALDAVSDRDFAAEYLFCASLVMAHLSRLAEDTILYTSDEFGYWEIPDELSTGSSIMPQKKNPDLPELVRGKTGRVYGDLIALLTVIKGIPLAYNKDLQEDKEPYFDASATAESCVKIYTELLARIKLNVNRMYYAASEGFSTATDVANYLTGHGIPFRDAHAVTGKIVRYCIENHKALTDLTLEEFRAASPAFEEDILTAVTVRASVDARNSVGGASRAAVTEGLASVRRRLRKYLA